MLALSELFARRLDERPYELLILRGIDLHDLLAQVKKSGVDPDLPPLAFGASEEPILFPEAEEADLDSTLAPAQTRWLVGAVSARSIEAANKALLQLAEQEEPSEEQENS